MNLALEPLLKANSSGGGFYQIVLPFWGADPPFEMETDKPAFTDHLRNALRWAGFPALAHHEETPGVRGFVEEMTKGFVPF